MLPTDLHELRAATKNFASRYQWDTAVTLTLKQAVRVNGQFRGLDRIEASQALKHFLKVLERRLWPHASRNCCRLQTFPIYEGTSIHRPHYHLALLRPSHVCAERFAALIQEAWSKTTWGYSQNLVTTADVGWITYITKLRTKADYFDAIDWENVHLPVPV